MSGTRREVAKVFLHSIVFLSGADFAHVLFALVYRSIKDVRLEENVLDCVFPVFLESYRGRSRSSHFL